jgi:hypothetical protein
MGETMNKRLATIAAVILLVLIPAFGAAWAASWGELAFDPEVPSQARKNFQKAIDAVDELFTKYKIVLSTPVTAVVTANTESYIQALMLHCNKTRAEAEHKATDAAGVSLGISCPGIKHAILIRWRPSMQATGQGTSYPVNNPEEGFHSFPHELFHEVQNQCGGVSTVNWLQEGPAELFRFMAFETAGMRRVTYFVQQSEQRIRQAAAIPDTRQLATNDHKTWQSLAEQKYPVYDMAFLMTYRLVGDNGFEKEILFLRLLHNLHKGDNFGKEFITAFGKPMSAFLTEMNEYFNNLRR